MSKMRCVNTEFSSTLFSKFSVKGTINAFLINQIFIRKWLTIYWIQEGIDILHKFSNFSNFSNFFLCSFIFNYFFKSPFVTFPIYLILSYYLNYWYSSARRTCCANIWIYCISSSTLVFNDAISCVADIVSCYTITKNLLLLWSKLL
jgi:hypothetical protein